MDCNIFKDCIQSLETKDAKDSRCTKEKCLKSYDTRKKVVVQENRKKYEIINNGTKIAVYQVDGELILSTDTIKCDNMIVVPKSKIAVLVELKGSNLQHAFEQLCNTYDIVNSYLSKYCVLARVITSDRTNVPKIQTCPQYIKLLRKLKGASKIEVRPREYSEKLEDMEKSRDTK